MNLSGAKSKLSKINKCLVGTPYDVFTLQETWFDESVLDSNYLAGTDYQCFRSDRSDSLSTKLSGGGVLTIISGKFLVERFVVKRKLHIEYVITKITSESFHLVIMNFYIPIGKTLIFLSLYVEEISYVLSESKSKFPEVKVLILGDFNFGFINWVLFGNGEDQLNVIASSVQDLFWSYSLTQFNEVRNSNDALLDLCLSDLVNVHVVEVHPELAIDSMSLHHTPLEIRISIAVDGPSDCQTHRLIRSFDSRKARSILMNRDVSFFGQFSNELIISEEQGLAYLNVVDSFLEKVNSESTVYLNKRIRMSKFPWLKNSRLYPKLERERKVLLRRFKESNNVVDRDLYVAKLREVRILFNDLKISFLDRFISLGNSPKSFFDLMNHKIRLTTELPNTLVVDGQMVTGSGRNDALFGALISAYGSHSDSSHLEFLDRATDVYNVHFSIQYSHLWDDIVFDITPGEVLDIIKGLNTRKNTGPLGWCIQLFTGNAAIMADILSDVFNTIIKSGVILGRWKTNFLIPIFKKGDKLDPGNYRGISIQSTILKILDCLLTKRLIQFSEKVLPDSQYGFRKKRGVRANLFDFTQCLHLALAKGGEVHVFYFDASKAFDSVQHLILAEILAKLSCPFIFFIVLCQFLCGRTQSFCLDPNLVFVPPTGVPQGSHNGPIQFILYVLFVGYSISYEWVRLFWLADDLKLMCHIMNENDKVIVQEIIDRIVADLSRLKLKINSQKTKFVRFGRHKFSDPRYYVDNTVIAEVPVVNDLGVLFDNKLSFNEHNVLLAKKIRNRVLMSSRIAKDYGISGLNVKLFNAYHRPIVEYCNVITSNGGSIYLSKIESSIRLMTRLNFGQLYRQGNLSYGKRLIECNTFTNFHRIEIARIMFIVKIMRNEAFSIFRSEIMNRLNLYDRNRRVQLSMFTINRRVDKMNSPLIAALTTMNKYQGIIDFSQSINLIKKQFKELCFREYELMG